jgi:hypothetical protein
MRQKKIIKQSETIHGREQAKRNDNNEELLKLL